VIARVLGERGEPMRTRAVHAEVEALLGVPVRWSTVKATLAGNLDPAPRCLRTDHGVYGIPSQPRRQAHTETRDGGGWRRSPDASRYRFATVMV